MKLRSSSVIVLLGAALPLGGYLQAQTTFPANTSYYVGYTNCSDSNPNPTAGAPWCTFTNINGNTFSPGDHLYLQAGGSWNEELDLSGTGTANNWITLSSYGNGANPNNFPDFTFTNNLQAVSASDTWNAFNGFSSIQRQNQWSYLYWNGSSYANMDTYNAFGTDGIWSSWGANHNTSLIWRSQMLPDACNTCWTARAWTAPQAGNISIRGWVVKDTSGGSGVQVAIVQHGSINENIMAPAMLSGTDMTGFATNVDTSVAQGDTIYFQVNDDGSGSNANDTISWAPNIVYTSTVGNGSNLLNNAAFTNSLTGWNEYGTPVSAITEPNSGEVQMYDASQTSSLAIGQSVNVASGTPFVASVSANTGNTSGAYLTVYDGVYATPLCTVALPSTNYPNGTTYTCSGTADSSGVLFYSLGSGTSPAGAWVDFKTPSLVVY